jgi:hypothetical protein
METANAVTMDERTARLSPEFKDANVSVKETLKDVSVVTATEAFYDEFTHRTRIPVGDLGRVGNLDELECPDWFIGRIYRRIQGLYLYHQSKLRQQSIQFDDSLCLAIAVSRARSIAIELSQKYGCLLVDRALTQILEAEKMFDSTVSHEETLC